MITLMCGNGITDQDYLPTELLRWTPSRPLHGGHQTRCPTWTPAMLISQRTTRSRVWPRRHSFLQGQENACTSALKALLRSSMIRGLLPCCPCFPACVISYGSQGGERRRKKKTVKQTFPLRKSHTLCRSFCGMCRRQVEHFGNIFVDVSIGRIHKSEGADVRMFMEEIKVLLLFFTCVRRFFF